MSKEFMSALKYGTTFFAIQLTLIIASVGQDFIKDRGGGVMLVFMALWVFDVAMFYHPKKPR